MQKAEEDDMDGVRSRPTSRRNSVSSRRSSIKKERDGRKSSPLSTATSSASSTPKKQVKEKPDFCVTGKQILKKSDRANSLPGYQRRPSAESVKRRDVRPAPTANSSQSKSRETSLEDDMSLDLSQVSDFEDSNSKYGTQKMAALATSTPKSAVRHIQKRSASMQSQLHLQKIDSSKKPQKLESGRQSNSTFCSRDSLYKTNSTASNNRYGTELDYSSVSPEYSGQSSVDISPRNLTTTLSPRSQELHVSSCCISSWQDCSEQSTKVEEYQRDGGEWNSFWANYNNSLAKVPVKSYYDQCPTPYRTEDIHLQDLDFSTASSRKRSPDELKKINNIIRNEGLQLTPRETQNMIKCAHILGNVLSKAIERRSKEKDLEIDEEDIDEMVHEIEEISVVNKTENEKPKEKPVQNQTKNLTIIENPLQKLTETLEDEKAIDTEQDITDVEPQPDANVKEIKKKFMTLNLKETVLPIEVKEEKRQETVMTQTDISLPNTKSAPRIFEKILRQLSRSSLDESFERSLDKKIENKEGLTTTAGKNVDLVENK